MNTLQLAMSVSMLGASILILWACYFLLMRRVTLLHNILRRQDEEQTDLFTKNTRLRYDLDKLRDRVANLEWDYPATRSHLHGTVGLEHRQFIPKEGSDDVA